MGRIFRRGELKQAILVILESIGSAHGYAIMGELKERIGGGWKPSPGAIYPAILALVEQGYVATEQIDGTNVYSLTADGLREARTLAVDERWQSLNLRAQRGEERITVGLILDDFAANSEIRRRLTGLDQRQEIESILEQASKQIEQTLDKGDNHG